MPQKLLLHEHYYKLSSLLSKFVRHVQKLLQRYQCSHQVKIRSYEQSGKITVYSKWVSIPFFNPIFSFLLKVFALVYRNYMQLSATQYNDCNVQVIMNIHVQVYYRVSYSDMHHTIQVVYFAGKNFHEFRVLEKNYTQKTKFYMVHTLFLTDSRKFNPAKYTTYTVHLL